ncbi:KdsC family phosphatase [Litchfieldella rifensis]|uniref:3-deoxy-D-manno-octulosonate 8-phosphate phosphatase KdsC n=1 Tax=Litchfieldella rifensis TaxID=762643 RepID=A0ABV7LVV2_9GAMM
MEKIIDLRRSIKLVLFDVDGVLTDGTLYIGGSGEEYKPFNAKDGVAVSLLSHYGIKAGVISGKSSPALLYRVNQLKMDVIRTGCSEKSIALHEIAQGLGISASEVCFVGDDIIDYHAMNEAGVSYAPNDAHPLILKCADQVTKCAGGAGVAREVAEDILSAHGYSLHDMYSFMLKKDMFHDVTQ